MRVKMRLVVALVCAAATDALAVTRRRLCLGGGGGGAAALAVHAFAPAAVAADTFVDGPRGLRYAVTAAGTGPAPARGQKVQADYTLTLGGFADAGGAVVDSSSGFLKRPFEFCAGVGEVIKGWDLAVMDMKEGEARRLIVPPDLGYGARGAGGKIPGGATLYFEVALARVIGAPPDLDEKQRAWLEEHPL